MTPLDHDGDRLTRFRDRHFDFHARLAEEADTAVASSRTEPRSWLELMDAEQPNIRSALEWGFERGHPEVARFACSLGWYWIARRRFIEGRKALDRVLRSQNVSESDRLEALLVAGGLAMEQGELEVARERFHSAEELAASLEDPSRHQRAIRGLGWTYFYLNLGPPAIEAFTRALALSDSGNPVVRADLLRGLAWSKNLQDGEEPAFDLLREAREILESSGDRSSLLEHYLVESNFLAFSTRADEAMSLAERALILSREQDDEGAAKAALLTMAGAAEQSGDREAMRRIVPEALAAARRVEDRGAQARALRYQAVLSLEEGDRGTARAATDDALDLLQMLDELGVGDLHIQADLLTRRAEIASDDGDTTLAEELYRQAEGVRAGISPLDHSAALAQLGAHLIEHGDLPNGRSALERALALADPLDEVEATDLRSDLALLDGDVEASLNLRTRRLEKIRTAWPRFLPKEQRRRAELLMLLGRFEEASEALDEAFAASRTRPGLVLCRVHLVRARLRVMTGDGVGARSDLIGAGNLAAGAGARDLMTITATLARLALLEGDNASVATLWSTLTRARVQLGQVPTILDEAFEAPLVQSAGVSDSVNESLPNAVAELRQLVVDRVHALAVKGETPVPGGPQADRK